MNTFTNLFLAIVILLSKLTCLREFFILYILWNSKFLRSSLNTSGIFNILEYIHHFQSFRTMLLLKTSEVSLSTNSICVFAMLNLIALNFSTSNFQANCFKIKFYIVLH